MTDSALGTHARDARGRGLAARLVAMLLALSGCESGTVAGSYAHISAERLMYEDSGLPGVLSIPPANKRSTLIIEADGTAKLRHCHPRRDEVVERGSVTVLGDSTRLSTAMQVEHIPFRLRLRDRDSGSSSTSKCSLLGDELYCDAQDSDTRTFYARAPDEECTSSGWLP